MIYRQPYACGSLAGLIYATASLAGPLAALAAPEDGWVTGGNSRVRLIACDTILLPTPESRGGMAALIEIELDKGWKTYWRMPGDSGVAPEFDWSAAPNVAKAVVLYPAPQRLSDQGGEAIGYKTVVTFPVSIERKDKSQPSAPVVTMNYGLCKNICVPVEVKVTSVCEATANAAAIGNSVGSVPRPADQRRPDDPKLVGVTGSVAALPAALTIDVDFGAGATQTDLFIEAPDGLYVPLPAPALPDATGRARFKVDLSKTSDPKELSGKPLRLTMVSSKGASEAVWVAK